MESAEIGWPDPVRATVPVNCTIPAVEAEIVICVGPPQENANAPKDVDRLLVSLAAEMPASKAAAEAAKMTGQPKQALYRRLLELRDG